MPDLFIKKIMELAGRGDAEMQGLLGYALESGKGLMKNEDEALRWYHRSAEQGNVLAQCHLGRHYGQCVGTEEDHVFVGDEEKSAYWYRKAAEQGNIDAQAMLGLFLVRRLDSGCCSEADLAEAAKCLRLAAEQGDEIAHEV